MMLWVVRGGRSGLLWLWPEGFADSQTVHFRKNLPLISIRRPSNSVFSCIGHCYIKPMQEWFAFYRGFVGEGCIFFISLVEFLDSCNRVEKDCFWISLIRVDWDRDRTDQKRRNWNKIPCTDSLSITIYKCMNHFDCCAVHDVFSLCYLI